MWHGEFRHPRLVEIFDAQFSWSRENDFFFAFVNQTPSARVVDPGCGTGRLTLAATGFNINQVYGGWVGEPVGSTDGELLVLAHRQRLVRPAHVARK
jgi:hypothetical protein